jgi:isopentenyldiphosphate isomerase/intracellular septation protein A
MNKYQLLKKFLPGLLPLVIFIVVDEIWGTTPGLIVAVGFGVIQLLYTYLKTTVFDKFTLFDTSLIVILGATSYILDNDIFFKLKPALIGVILCIILGLSAFSKLNIFALMSKRYIDGLNINDEQLKHFNRSLKTLFFIFSFHTLLVFYSAFYMSKEAWAFISTVLFYILFGVYFIFELLKNKFMNLKYRNEEWLPLVDEKGNVLGKAPRSVVHKNKDALHPVVHMHLLNKNKQIYLQKRLMSKLVQPGKWDTSVGGHVSINESIDFTLQRESVEEIGIKDFIPVAIGQYIWKSEIESELVFIFYTRFDGPVNYNTNEVEEGRFWKISEIKSNLGKNVFTPNFEVEFEILKKNHII